LEFAQRHFGIRHVQQSNFAISQKFLRGAGITTVVAFAGENQDRVARLGEPERALGDRLADAADDCRFRLAGGPSGIFPFAHRGSIDYGH
jgi:hypothetical protein